MSMEISGSNNRTQTDYTEQLREKQSLDRAEKVKEAKDGRNDVKVSGKVPEPQDEYISSEKQGAKPSGLYWIGQDENGNKKVFFDDPNQSDSADGKRPNKANAGSPEKPAEKCIGNTDKVEREIRKLKEKKQQLLQQIRSASGEEGKVKELEKKLAQVESELSRKDNESYRRQHTTFSS